MPNIMKYNYKELVESRGLKFLKWTGKSCVIEDGDGYLHNIGGANVVGGVMPSIKSLLNKGDKTKYCLDKIIERHPDVFEKSAFDKFEYVGALKYATATCLKHGDYKTKPNWLMSRGHHCEKCSDENRSERRFLTTEDFIKRAKFVHGDRYNYSKTVYKGAKKPVTITCREHGDFQIIANYHSGDTCGCQKCGIEASGYSRSEYSNACPNGSNVYVMRFSNHEECFIKIGISKDCENRLRTMRQQSGYNIELIHKEFYPDAGVAWDVELMMHREFRQDSYKPKIKFQGETECFNPNVESEVSKLLQCVA